MRRLYSRLSSSSHTHSGPHVADGKNETNGWSGRFRCFCIGSWLRSFMCAPACWAGPYFYAPTPQTNTHKTTTSQFPHAAMHAARSTGDKYLMPLSFKLLCAVRRVRRIGDALNFTSIFRTSRACTQTICARGFGKAKRSADAPLTGS